MKRVFSVVVAMICTFAIAQRGTEQVDDKKLKQLEKSYVSAKAAFGKKPKDAKVKRTYLDSTLAYGLGNMYSVSLPPNQKYKMALVYFREVLKVEPNNKVAKENKEMIESIYKSMGRPVPK